MIVASGAKTSSKESNGLNRLAAVWKRDTEDNFQDEYYYRVTNTTGSEMILDMVTTPSGDSSIADNSNVEKSVPLKLSAKSVKVFSGEILKAIGRDKIMGKVYAGELSVHPLGIEVDVNYRILNHTARRIGIQNYDPDKEDLVIPPFGMRSVNSNLLRWYQFRAWQRQDLIQIEREDEASHGPGNWATIWNWIKLLPGLALVVLIGFGIPLWVVYHFGGGDHLISSFVTGEMFSNGQQGMALMGLGRLFQVGFICVASILPALFYYLFGRQQVEKLRQKFFHDVLVLDPHIYTLSEAQSKYDTLLSSAYGSSSSGSPLAILLLMFSTAILVAGWTLTVAPYGLAPQGAASLADFFLVKPSPLTLGFLGAYFFSINMIFRRYVRADLTPKTYAYITVRMLVTFILVWGISALPEFSGSIMKDGFLPLAFIIGVFPENGFRVLRDSGRNISDRIIRTNGKKERNDDEKYPLAALEGLNQYDQARLLEEGIENIENLAHHNLIELLAFTRIPTARLVDMFDQAILYLHLGLFDESDDEDADDHPTSNQANLETGKSADKPVQKPPVPQKGKSDSGRELLKYLKSFGVRTATDLIKLIDSEEDFEISDVVPSDTKIAQLRTIRITFGDDEWLSYILNWRKESSKDAVIRASFVNDPYQFYETGSRNSKKAKRKASEKNGMVEKRNGHKPVVPPQVEGDNTEPTEKV